MDTELQKKLAQIDMLYKKFVKAAEVGEMTAGEKYDFHALIGSLYFNCCEVVPLIKIKPLI